MFSGLVLMVLMGQFFQVDLASEECLLIRTTAFVEELRKRMYTKVNTEYTWKV